jgi:uncharacterized protein (DUF433 family)
MMANRMERPMLAAEEGCYEAGRAAALSGVPVSTVYYWAKTGVVVPSISPMREKLWSYADLMTLRVVSWLRRPKGMDHGVVRASPMRQVRETLAFLDRHGIDLWQSGAAGADPLLVDRGGKIRIRNCDGSLTDSAGHSTLELHAEYLNILAPYSESGQRGPDLVWPRPRLHIVLLKVAGEPHIAGSRITSRSLDALARRGFGSSVIADMYGLDEQSVDESLDLERQLSLSTQPAA